MKACVSACLLEAVKFALDIVSPGINVEAAELTGS